MSLADFKELVREQYFSLLLNENAALAAIPAMLPADAAVRDELLADIRRTVNAAGSFGSEELRRLETVEALFAGKEQPAPRARKSRPAKV